MRADEKIETTSSWARLAAAGGLLTMLIAVAVAAKLTHSPRLRRVVYGLADAFDDMLGTKPFDPSKEP
jgi:hypothetical protein